MKYFLIFLSGIVAGFINVNAGGGSLITLPALIFLGVPPVTANGTNRIAILGGAVSATINFYRKKSLDLKLGLLLLLPTVTGAVAGTLLAVNISDKTFEFILSGVMIFVFFAIFLKPAFSRKRSDKPLSRSRKIVIAALFLILGFYGGFIQAGVGILTIALLSISTGYSLLRINGIKVFLVMIYTSFSLILFFIHGRINIPFGLSLAAGHVIGAYAASSLAVKKGDTISKAVLLIALAGMAAKITGIF